MCSSVVQILETDQNHSMKRLVTFSGLFPIALLLALFFHSQQTKLKRPEPPDRMGLPPVMLWAWERPVDLEFLDSTLR